MRVRMAIAIVMASGATIAAQQSSQDKMTPQTDQAATTVTIQGCVQNETAVLKQNAVTSQVGMTDEFVITNAMLHKGAAGAEPPATADDPARTDPSRPTDPSKPSEAVGTSGSGPAFGKVYRVTGDKENELKPQIGQRVEITGTFKDEEEAKAELGAVGTSGRTVTGELTEANTPEITIVSIKALAGTCAPGPGK